MRNKRIFIFLALMLVWGLKNSAQTNMVFYPIDNQFNSSGFNPAFLTSQNQFSFSIFPLAGMNVGYNNQLVIKNMLTKVVQGDQTNDDFREVFNSMVKLDLFYQRMETSLVNFGYNSDFGSLNFRIQENIQLLTDLKGEFSEFLANSSSYAVTINKPQMFPAHAMHYREYSLGYAKEVLKEKLSVGIRAKLYFGKSAMISDVKGVVVKRDNNFYLQTHDRIKFSFPMKIVPDADSLLRAVELDDHFAAGDYLMNSKNRGVGFDIGFSYQITPDLELSASALDVGKINWKSNLNTMIFKGEYKFPDEFIRSGDLDILTRNDNFSPETTDFPELYKIGIKGNSYSTSLPITVLAGLKYKLSPRLNIGLVDRYIRTKYMGYNSITATGVLNIDKNFTVSTGYSVLGSSYNNIPFALLYNWEGGQTYLGTDNILSYIVSSVSEFSGISFGTCFFLSGRKSKYKKQLEYQPFYREKKQKPISRKGLVFNNYHQN